MEEFKAVLPILEAGFADVRLVGLTGFAGILAFRVDIKAFVSLVYKEELLVAICIECIDFEGVAHFVGERVLQSLYFQSNFAIRIRRKLLFLNNV